MSPVKPDLPVTVYIEMKNDSAGTITCYVHVSPSDSMKNYKVGIYKSEQTGLRKASPVLCALKKKKKKKNARNSRSLLKTVQMCSMSMID